MCLSDFQCSLCAGSAVAGSTAACSAVACSRDEVAACSATKVRFVTERFATSLASRFNLFACQLTLINDLDKKSGRKFVKSGREFDKSGRKFETESQLI